jgi:uncharacterized protein YhfF
VRPVLLTGKGHTLGSVRGVGGRLPSLPRRRPRLIGEMPMKRVDGKAEAYWQRFLDTLPEDSRCHSRGYCAEKWGDYREMAEELGELIADGVKTAACSSVWEWEAEGRSIPEVGMITVVLSWDDDPLCIIETIEVDIKPYNQVDARFAHEEGEGDRTLAYWRKAHWKYFSRVLASIGKEPQGDMPLVCERFRVIYKE